MFGGGKKVVPKKAAKKVVKKEEPTPKQGINPYGVIGWLALFGQLAPAGLVGLARLGLVKAPPLNTLTDIANNAMDEAIANGCKELLFEQKLFATAYGQGIWKDLIAEYYSSGETTDFLTKAGGVCAEHPGWCEGITIPVL